MVSSLSYLPTLPTISTTNSQMRTMAQTTAGILLKFTLPASPAAESPIIPPVTLPRLPHPKHSYVPTPLRTLANRRNESERSDLQWVLKAEHLSAALSIAIGASISEHVIRNVAASDGFWSTPLTEFDDVTLLLVVVTWLHPEEPPLPCEFWEDELFHT